MVAVKGSIAAAFFAAASIEAFSIPAFQPKNGVHTKRNNAFSGVSMATVSDDCGCQPQVTFSGKVPETARTLNHREAVREHPIYNVDGESVTMDQLIGEPASDQVSIVVFLRTLG
jgi:hypothetical protein